MLVRFINFFRENTFWALAIKEFNHIKRNRQLMFLLVFPPTIQLLLYGFMLNPDVHELKLGIVDYANVSVSRGFIAELTESHVFVAQKYFLDERSLDRDLEAGNLDAGIVIPPDFARALSQDKTVKIQFWLDGINANSAGIAKNYIKQIVTQYSLQNLPEDSPPLIHPEVNFLYNPGLVSSWFFVPGAIGLVLTLISSLTTALTVVLEKDRGTIEQLLMTPATDWEILLAKIVPLMVLLMGDVLLGLSLGCSIFGIPFRGSLPLFLALSCLYLLVCMGIGMMLATLCHNQRQVVLLSFFINVPLIQLSGVIAPIETMPVMFQYLSLLNPLRHYVTIARGILLKGVSLDVLWPYAIALGTFAIILVTVSILRFRVQQQ